MLVLNDKQRNLFEIMYRESKGFTKNEFLNLLYMFAWDRYPIYDGSRRSYDSSTLVGDISSIKFNSGGIQLFNHKKDRFIYKDGSSKWSMTRGEIELELNLLPSVLGFIEDFYYSYCNFLISNEPNPIANRGFTHEIKTTPDIEELKQIHDYEKRDLSLRLADAEDQICKLKSKVYKYENFKIGRTLNAPEQLSSIKNLQHYHNNKQCVYFLIENDLVVYVGQTKRLVNRIQNHKSDKQFDDVFYIAVPKEEALDIESYWIRTLNPKYNLVGGCRQISFG